MIYIGFSTKSHKIIAQTLCKQFRHCAPIVIKNDKGIIYQFVNTNNIVKIYIKSRDIKILERYGWKFIKYNGKFAPKNALKQQNIYSCVQFTKRACGIKKITIQTPDGLFRFLNTK